MPTATPCSNEFYVVPYDILDKGLQKKSSPGNKSSDLIRRGLNYSERSVEFYGKTGSRNEK